MKVILRSEIKGLGKRGEIHDVSGGYARNYLLPNNLAVPATDKGLKIVEQETRARKAAEQREKKRLLALAEKIAKMSCSISVRTGEGDKLFGSVTSADIVSALKNEGIEIDRHQVVLDEPIKSVGIFNVPVRLYPEVVANLRVWVVKEGANREEK